MNQHLSSYLHDHIAGAISAIEVIGILNGGSHEPALTSLIRRLSVEVGEDKDALERLAEEVAEGSSSIKDSAAWVGARVVGLKVRAGKEPFGVFEALEFLAVGVQGKLHLWKALQRSATCMAADRRPDYQALIRRAEAQHAAIEEMRLVYASVVL